MDLSTLGSTLPPGLADAERDMGNKFRAAALSITTLYKSSLGATKQAYHSGYSACLSDVLSTVQSSIASGQDASQTLSRLMDWVEGREAAMAAFAADELEEPSPAVATPLTGPRRSTLVKNALSHLQGSTRSASVPIPEHVPSQPVSHVHTAPAHSTPQHTPSHLTSQTWQPTPTSLISSPATPGPSSIPRPTLLHANSRTGKHRQHSHSPVRTSHRVENATLGHPPSSCFNPSLPALPTPNGGFISSSAPNLPLGTKRPLLDIDMTEDGGGPPRATPSRSSKRRSLGNNMKKEKERDKDEEGEGGDKRRGGRRGHGPGPATAT